MQLAISQGDEHRANRPMVTQEKFLMTTTVCWTQAAHKHRLCD